MDKKIKSNDLIEKLKELCNSFDEIQNDSKRQYFGEIILCIQKGQLYIVKKSETIK